MSNRKLSSRMLGGLRIAAKIHWLGREIPTNGTWNALQNRGLVDDNRSITIEGAATLYDLGELATEGDAKRARYYEVVDLVHNLAGRATATTREADYEESTCISCARHVDTDDQGRALPHDRSDSGLGTPQFCLGSFRTVFAPNPLTAARNRTADDQRRAAALMEFWSDTAGQYVNDATGVRIERRKGVWIILVPTRDGYRIPRAHRSSTLAGSKRAARMHVRLALIAISRAWKAAHDHAQWTAGPTMPVREDIHEMFNGPGTTTQPEGEHVYDDQVDHAEHAAVRADIETEGKSELLGDMDEHLRDLIRRARQMPADMPLYDAVAGLASSLAADMNRGELAMFAGFAALAFGQPARAEASVTRLARHLYDRHHEGGPLDQSQSDRAFLADCWRDDETLRDRYRRRAEEVLSAAFDC